MHIRKVVIKNYRTLKDVTVEFTSHLNILVGDNECGKSTLLEAINLCLSGQVAGRNIQYDLHSFFFHLSTVNDYVSALASGSPLPPPSILIELYFDNDPALANLEGSINSLKENAPGISLSIEFDEDYKLEYQEYIKKPADIRTIPIEYYTIVRKSFANEIVTSRGIPVKGIMIDATSITHNLGANKYILDMLRDFLSAEQRVQLSLSYRKMREAFSTDKNVIDINSKLAAHKDNISEKNLSVALDTTSKTGWENGISPQLDAIPLALVGKGEQSCVKIKLAVESSSEANVFLIEEPENHLSHSNLNILLKKISEKTVGRQVIVTTHSSFVLNKLGIDNLILFTTEKNIRFSLLNPTTQDYFKKLSGYNTLRVILAKKVILVEGPSDELVIQKACLNKYKKMPQEMGWDVVSVAGLSFKRFLEIAEQLDIEMTVVTDNDGDVAALKKKYGHYLGLPKIRILYDTDISKKTLEPQILKVNDRATLNKVFGVAFATDPELLNYMQKNKSDCALAIFNTKEDMKFPEYINAAIA